jgi:hypothetical protein
MKQYQRLTGAVDLVVHIEVVYGDIVAFDIFDHFLSFLVGLADRDIG